MDAALFGRHLTMKEEAAELSIEHAKAFATER